MKGWIGFALAVAGMSVAQLVPWGFGLEQGKAMIVFASSCNAVATASKLNARVVLSLPEGRRCQALGVEAIHDPGGLLRATFYVDREPAVVVLKEGQQVFAIRGPLTPPLVDAISQILRDDRRYPPKFALKIRTGRKLTGALASYTGLIAFWKEGCPWCQRERDALARLCRKVPVLLVSNTPGEPSLPACSRRGNWRIYRDWGLPGAPTHVWVEKGVVRWIDVGYRPRLMETVLLLASRGEGK